MAQNYFSKYKINQDKILWCKCDKNNNNNKQINFNNGKKVQDKQYTIMNKNYIKYWLGQEKLL